MSQDASKYSQLFKYIREFVIDHELNTNLDDSDSLIHLGFDSFLLIELLVGIEKNFKIKADLSTIDREQLDSVEKFISAIKDK
jgi:acyl carrier protein